MTFKYNWGKYPNVIVLLTKLYNSMNISLDKEYANEFLIYIEDYLYYIYYYYNRSFEKVIDSLNKIESIEFQEISHIVKGRIMTLSAKIKTPVVRIGNKILLTPIFANNDKLTEEESRRMYLYHGLSNFVLDFKNEKTQKFSKIYSDALSYDKNDVETIIDNGWLLLEEVIAQELAERITYTFIGKKRPEYRYGIEFKDLFPIDSASVYSNLEFYRMFQDIIINFGLTISKIGSTSEYSQTLIIHDILKKAINNNFSCEVISEYISKKNTTELYILLYLMGLLLNEKYDTFNLKLVPNVKVSPDEINQIYIAIYNLVTPLFNLEQKTYRESPEDEIETIEEKTTDVFLKRRILKIIRERDYKV